MKQTQVVSRILRKTGCLCAMTVGQQISFSGKKLLLIAEIVQRKCIMWTKCRDCKCYSKWYMWLPLSFKRLPGTTATRITQLQVMQFQIRAIFKKKLKLNKNLFENAGRIFFLRE
jgi:hypothetical protein